MSSGNEFHSTVPAQEKDVAISFQVMARHTQQSARYQLILGRVVVRMA